MFSSDKWFGAEAGFYPETINQSVRFNDDDSPQLTRTFVTPTSNTKMIYATWFKSTENSSHQTFFSGGSDSFNYMVFALSTASFYSNSDSLFFSLNTSNTGRLRLFTDTTYGQFFADTTNWQHILLAIDTTQATNTNRILVFHNGKRLAHSDMSSTIYPSQDYSVPLLNTAIAHNFGFNKQSTTYGSFDGYFAETYFLDGQSIFSDTSGTINSTFLADATTLAMFCEQKNGIAVPKTYSGAFGNNGFKLEYASNHLNTSGSAVSDPNGSSTDLQNNAFSDASGNGHHVDISNITSTDILPDSPTKNFPIMNFVNTNSNLNVSEGGLKIIPANTSNYYRAMSTMAVPTTGKWYWEVRLFVASYLYIFGLYDVDSPTNQRAKTVSASVTASTNDYQVRTSNSLGIDISTEGAAFSDWLSTNIASGDIISFAYDADNNKLWFGLNGTFQNTSGTANPATGTDPRFSSMASTQYYIGANMPNPASGGAMFNFGADDTFAGAISSSGNTDANGAKFKYTPPSGFVGLNASTLPTGAISPDAEETVDDFFRTVIYTGNGYPTSNGQTITGVGFQPDWTWIKVNRNGYNHYLLDSVRGATKVLRTTSTNAQNTESTALTSWNGDGFVLGSNNEVNYQNDTIASWNWRAGGAPSADNSAGAGNVPTSNSVIIDGVSKTDALAGTIPATRISANTTSGFSIITYTGTGTAGTVAHGLGKTPALLLTKNISWTDSYSAWLQWHHKRDNAFNASTNYGYMNLSSVGGSSTTAFYNGSQIDANVFGIGTNDAINDASYSYVTYAFTEVAGYSKFGIYEGAGTTDNAFIYCGFTPKYLLIKNIDASSDWVIRDDFNSGYYTRVGNPKSIGFEANTTKGHQGAIGWRVDFLSSGFKIVSTQTDLGASNTYYYWAFGNDFKFSNGI